MMKLPSANNGKSMFLTGKEKLIGALVWLVPASLFTFFFGAPILNRINEILLVATDVVGNAIMLIVLAFIAMVMLWFAFNPRTWTMLFYTGHRVMNAMTKSMIKSDPIGMMRTFAEVYLQKKLDQIIAKLNVVKAARRKVADTVERNLERIRDLNDQARVLHSRSFDETNEVWKNEEDLQLFREHSMNADILESSTSKLQKQLDRLDLYVAVLEKFTRAFESRKRNTQFLVDVLSTEYEATKATAEAGAAVGALFGSDDHKRVFDMSVEYVREQVATYITAADTALSFTKGFTQEMDLKGDVAEKRMLDELSSKVDALIIGGQREHKLIAEGHVMEVVQGGARELVPVRSSSTSGKTSDGGKKYGDLL